MLTKFFKSGLKLQNKSLGLSTASTNTLNANSSLLRMFSSRIKTNRKWGEKAPARPYKYIHGTRHEQYGYFKHGDLPYNRM